MPAQKKIWMIWALNKRDVISLREISTTRSRADLALKMLRREPDLKKAWDEERITNHLYGHTVHILFPHLEAVRRRDGD